MMIMVFRMIAFITVEVVFACENNYYIDLNYIRVGKASYHEARLACIKIGKKLCSYQDYCPGGEGSEPIRGRGAGNDVWAPISDKYNEWVQLSDRRVCKKHSSHGYLPKWGMRQGCCQNDEVLCCIPLEDRVEEEYTSVGRVSYRKAQAACKNKGKELCSYKDYCPHGEGSVPIRGPGEGKDVWAPISDEYNEWVQLSDSRTCKTHSRHGYLPKWGTSHGCCHNNEILCCERLRTADLKYTRVGKVSYQEARAACNKKGRELCSYKDYCPGGPGSKPLRGRGAGRDVWAPISDRYNEWVQLSDRRVCKKHSSHGYLPKWGTRHGCCNNDEILCCSRLSEDPPRTMNPPRRKMTDAALLVPK